MLAGVLASFDESGGPLLWCADSIMRLMPMNGGQENFDLGVAFARRGDYKAAAAAARRRWLIAGPFQHLAVSLRQEGRWAALAGDTTAAIKAYRHYLLWRDKPEPILIPQRDSVRAELEALEQASRRHGR